jgi:hypothetical protein
VRRNCRLVHLEAQVKEAVNDTRWRPSLDRATVCTYKDHGDEVLRRGVRGEHERTADHDKEPEHRGPTGDRPRPVQLEETDTSSKLY